MKEFSTACETNMYERSTNVSSSMPNPYPTIGRSSPCPTALSQASNRPLVKNSVRVWPVCAFSPGKPNSLSSGSWLFRSLGPSFGVCPNSAGRSGSSADGCGSCVATSARTKSAVVPTSTSLRRRGAATSR